MSDIVGTTVLTSTVSAPASSTGSALTSTATQITVSGVSTSIGQSSLSTATGFSTGSTLTTPTGSSTTTKRCDEMQAIDKETSEKIIVTPFDVPQRNKPDFQPTSNQGVSFPKYERKPTITVTFGKPAEVQSVIIPRDKTSEANVQQFEVTFYSPEGKKINDKPIPSSSSPKDDKTKPPTLDYTQIPSNTPVSRVEITIVYTTNEESPKGVVLDIKACTEITTGRYP